MGSHSKKEKEKKKQLTFKGTSGVVHGGQQLAASNVFDGDFVLRHVKPMAVVRMLANQSNRRLCVVRVDFWQIQIVQKIHQPRLPHRAIVTAGFLFQRCLHGRLQEIRVGKEIKINRAYLTFFGFELGH